MALFLMFSVVLCWSVANGHYVLAAETGYLCLIAFAAAWTSAPK